MRALFTIIYLFLVQAAIGQRKMNAYVIELNGDSTFGKIDIYGLSETPEKIKFYDEWGDKRYITPDDIREFGLPGYCSYVSASVFSDYANYEFRKENLNSNPFRVRQQLFLKVLIKGPAITLLYAQDGRRRFFIQENTGNQTLDYHKITLEVEAWGRNVSDSFRVEMANILAHHGATFNFGTEIGYNRRDLMEIARALNQQVGQVTYDADDEISLTDRQLYFITALSRISTRGNYPAGVKSRHLTDSRVSLLVGFGMPRKFPFLKEHLTFRPEFTAVLFTPRFTSPSGEDEEAQVINLTFTPLVAVNPWKSNRHRPAFALGLEATYSWSNYIMAESYRRKHGGASDFPVQKEWWITPTFRVMQPFSCGNFVAGLNLPRHIFSREGISSRTQSIYAGVIWHISGLLEPL